MKGLIGYTGFVGSNLLAAMAFDSLYNSQNFSDLAGCEFELLVCAGISAAKWLANKNPEEDKQKIEALQHVLQAVRARTFVLISTIDVYPVQSGVDESYDCHTKDNHAYGSNRLAFEDFCREQFSDCYVVRLPGLFGPGLKKNVIFDLLHDNCLEMINPKSSFQYYDLRDLASDLDKALTAGIRTINLFTEPIATQTILSELFPDKHVGKSPGPEAHYDLRTRHAKLWDCEKPYVAAADRVMRKLADYVRAHSSIDGSK
jgi:nucleoside-diphosphate-sugar epimerase